MTTMNENAESAMGRKIEIEIEPGFDIFRTGAKHLCAVSAHKRCTRFKPFSPEIENTSACIFMPFDLRASNIDFQNVFIKDLYGKTISHSPPLSLSPSDRAVCLASHGIVHSQVDRCRITPTRVRGFSSLSFQMKNARTISRAYGCFIVQCILCIICRLTQEEHHNKIHLKKKKNI